MGSSSQREKMKTGMDRQTGRQRMKTTGYRRQVGAVMEKETVPQMEA